MYSLGSEPALSLGVDYVKMVIQQRIGKVDVADGRDDLSIVKVSERTEL
jgi:hypothetical protein